MELSVAEVIVESLKAEGIKDLPGVSGSSLFPILDVLYHTPQIRYIQSQHEQGASYMVNGYARSTRKPAVCLVSPGGGMTNALSAVAQAYATATPHILISVEEPTRLTGMGTSLAHSLDTEALFKPVTKMAVKVENPENVAESIQMAFRVAGTGRKGPVYLGFPRDFLEKKINWQVTSPSQYRSDCRVRGDFREIERAAELLIAAKKPVIMADDAAVWDDAQKVLLDLAERMAIPVVATEGNKGLIPDDHPLAMGVASIHGPQHALYTLQNADVILALGCDFGEFTTGGFGNKVVPKGAKIIQVDIDPTSLGKVYPVASGITGNTDTVIADLLEVLKERKVDRQPYRQSPWVKEVSRKKEEWENSVAPLRASGKVPIQRFRLFHDLRQALPREAVVAGGSGGTHGWFEHAFSAYVHTTYMGLWHAIGAEFPESLGAKLALPDKMVVLVIGDGGFMMHMQEIATAVAYKIPVLCIVCHNSVYGNMHHTQHKRYGGRFIGTDLPIPPLADIARDFGAYGEKVELPDQIIPAVKRALASNKFALLDVIIDASPDNLSAANTLSTDGWQRKE